MPTLKLMKLKVKGARLELFSAAAGCAAKPIAPINTAAQSMHALISPTLQNIFEPGPFSYLFRQRGREGGQRRKEIDSGTFGSDEKRNR
jgi:hypothetical protein